MLDVFYWFIYSIYRSQESAYLLQRMHIAYINLALKVLKIGAIRGTRQGCRLSPPTVCLSHRTPSNIHQMQPIDTGSTHWRPRRKNKHVCRWHITISSRFRPLPGWSPTNNWTLWFILMTQNKLGKVTNSPIDFASQTKLQTQLPLQRVNSIKYLGVSVTRSRSIIFLSVWNHCLPWLNLKHKYGHVSLSGY